MSGEKRTGVLWLDAHSDVNTPGTSPSGNIHGMPLAHLLGFGDERLLSVWGGGAVLRPEDIVFVGLRSVDDDERTFIREHGIKALTMKDIDTRGIADVAEEALAHLAQVEAGAPLVRRGRARPERRAGGRYARPWRAQLPRGAPAHGTFG